MIELSPVLLALAAGLVLGAIYFGGLWWTVLRGIGSRHAALWFSVSLLLRTAVAMLGFYLVARGSWERLVVCLAGFVVARFIMIWLTAAAGPRPQSAGGTSHAS
ncbi:MAG: ATP synthase subunit I [Steroidobacterales bacterium]